MLTKCKVLMQIDIAFISVRYSSLFVIKHNAREKLHVKLKFLSQQILQTKFGVKDHVRRN